MTSVSKTALLVIDMQAFFRPMTTTALPNILTLSKFFAKNSLARIFTQHGHPPSDFEPPITNQLVRKWGKEGSIHVDTPEWQLMPEIADLQHKEALIIRKTTYDAFLGTDLEQKLRDMQIERVVICGVMTDCCCDTTGRSAFCRGFETWMVKDATGSANKRQHEAALVEWAFGFGDCIDTKEVIRRLS
jgi:nicotinamidase-related amidase